MLSKMQTLFALFLIVALTTLTFHFGLNKSKNFIKHLRKLGSLRNSSKLVLLWTPGWTTTSGVDVINGWNISLARGCPHKCYFTDNRALINKSHALVYHGLIWGGNDKFMQLPPRNGLYDQIWMFLRVESPVTFVNDMTLFNNKFNWTATYRADSDVHYPYGEFVSAKIANPDEDFPPPTEESIRGKSLVAWMHSNCRARSRRDVLVDKLKKFIPVTVYGGCSMAGRLNCTRPQCYKHLSKYFKFWLAFENSLCADYVTEKLYLPLIYGMVPIIYADKSVARLIPPGSYINIRDFKTMKELADRLKFLDQNPYEYLKYFEWRKQFRSRLYPNDEFWCAFCTKLSLNNYPRKYYPSVQDWFYKNYSGTDQCSYPDAQVLLQ